MAWHSKTRALVGRLAFENKAKPAATCRALKHLADHLPSLHTSSLRLTPRERFAYAFDVVRNAYRALEPREAHRLFRTVDSGTLESRMAAADYLVQGCRDGKLPLYSLE